jgi:hypothetical protein
MRVFTEKARQAIAIAEEEAKMMRRAIEPGHRLLG